MSEEFDLTASTALAWEQFEEQFAAFLADMEPGEALVITIQSAASEEEVSPYLQLAAEEDYLRVAVSARFSNSGVSPVQSTSRKKLGDPAPS